jgi:DNA-binding MarR family transcriptional regulator
MRERSFETRNVPNLAGEDPLSPPTTYVDELERASRLLRHAAERFDRIAREEGWPAPFSLPRVLILCRLEEATAYGLSARRLAWRLAIAPSTLCYHLDALEAVGLVQRAPWTIHDRRKVAVRLTASGRYAARRLASQPPMRSPAIASP